MKQASLSARPIPVATTLSDLVALTKPRLSALVMITAAGAMYLAPGSLTALNAVVALMAIAGVVGGANALNGYIERESDRFMHRTRNRPLPAGRMEPLVALTFGVGLAVVSLPTLTLVTNRLTGSLALLAFLSYVAAYTPLKARSQHAMLVGALPGALPPLMGWTAVTNSLDAPGLLLFGVLFFWQLPHFIAIALFRKSEYAAAGLKSVPLAKGDHVARLQMVLYVLPLIGCSVALFAVGTAGFIYLVAAVLLGGALLAESVYGFLEKAGDVWAKRAFHHSLLYLSVLFVALAVDRAFGL